MDERLSFAPEPPADLRIGVVDDHAVVRAGIVGELNRQPGMAVVGSGRSGEDALRLARTGNLDLLILDISMPGPPVAELIVQLRSGRPALRVLILTAHREVGCLLSTIKAGASGYLLKDEDLELLPVAVRGAMRGDGWLSPAATALLVEHNIRGGGQPGGQNLSSRELDVLRELIEGRSNEEIGGRLHISERTVRFHLRNIYDKLGVRRGEAIVWGIRNGLGEA